MIAKSLIAAAAIATAMAVALPATEAEAKTNIDINIGLGVGGFYPGYAGGYYPGPVYQPNYVSCWKGGKIVDWSGFHNVQPVDCSLPSYRYTAWRNGHKFVVSMNRYGTITKVNKIF